MDRVFISYRHGNTEDEALAAELKDGLGGVGCEVFIDTGMTAGIDWVQEIENRIQWCTVLCVLLSEEALDSEAVQAEIRLAHRRRRKEGVPRIVPVRLRYFGPLNYELEIYLGRLQYLRWVGPDSRAGFLEKLLAAFAAEDPSRAIARLEPSPPVLEGEPRVVADRRPLPKIDPRTLSPPGGASHPDDPFYVARSADAQVEAAAAKVGQTIVIQGPRQTGKSSLLMRYLRFCKAAGKSIAFVNTRSVFDNASDYESFLAGIAACVARELRLTDVPRLSDVDITSYLEDQMLTVVRGPLVLVFDEADCVLGWPKQSAFFTTLRSWHENRANVLKAWDKVDLALAISTAPYLLIAETERSPFSVVSPIEVGAFTLEECSILNERAGGVLSDLELDELWQLLGGQPYLTRLAFYWLMAPAPIKFRLLVDTASEESGPFGPHLRSLLVRLRQYPGLLETFGQVIRYGSTRDEERFHRLLGAGLVRREGDRVNPANLLYARYFRKIL